jgi:hypothetical protein
VKAQFVFLSSQRVVPTEVGRCSSRRTAEAEQLPAALLIGQVPEPIRQDGSGTSQGTATLRPIESK